MFCLKFSSDLLEKFGFTSYDIISILAFIIDKPNVEL